MWSVFRRAPSSSVANAALGGVIGVTLCHTVRMDLLILGGTGFIGTHQVRYALARGHRVTLFNRGRRAGAVPGVEVLTGDRESGDYAALRGRRFDACIDNATLVPRWVRDVAAVLDGNVGHYSFISTTSVYASDAESGADEDAARLPYHGDDAMAHTTADVRADMSLYGPLKALAEDEAQRRFPGITAVQRPGLIVGPGDESDRFTYWPVRIARGGPVLIPPRADPIQIVDVRDLAEWSVRVAESRVTGTFNCKGPDYALTVGAMMDTLVAAVVTPASSASFASPGSSMPVVPVELCEATQAFLDANDVSAWTDLPVWIPGQGETAGAHRRSNERARNAGLSFRPLSVTARDTLAWWRTLPPERQTTLKFGMSAERETELLNRLRGN